MAKDHRWCPIHYIGEKDSSSRLVKVICLDCDQGFISPVGEDQIKASARLERANEYLLPCEESIFTKVMES